MLAKGFPPGRPSHFVDSLLGDELIEQLQPVLADHLGEEPPGDVPVDTSACSHGCAQRCWGNLRCDISAPTVGPR